jgi:uncharacterized protein (DUF2141 family)
MQPAGIMKSGDFTFNNKESILRSRVLFSALTLTSIIFTTGEALAARIVVTISGFRSNQGGVYVGLYATPSKFLNGTQVDVMKKVPASIAPITVTFDNLAPGTYAVGAYHDENNNDHFDTNFLGLPNEGYALSNGVRAVMSKPTFEQAAFTIGNAGAAIALQIRY